MGKRSVISAGGIVAIGMVAGRMLGLLREVAIAAYFGAGIQADTAILLLMIPDFITAVFIGSAVSAALIPAFAARSEERAAALFSQTMIISVLAFVMFAVGIFVGSQYLNWLPVAGENGMFFTLCSLPFAAATTIFTAWLQYRGRFSIPAFATVIFNLVILLALWLYSGDIVFLAIGIMMASLLRLAAHVIAFWRAGGRLRFKGARSWEIDGKLAATYGQTATIGVLGMLPLYAPYLIITASASGLALFNYAFKLALLPSMLLQTVIQTVLLPLFVNQNKNGEPEQLAKTYGISLYTGSVCGVAVALAVTLAAQPIAALCFGHGKMAVDSVAQIAFLLQIGIWSTPLAILSCLWQQMLYAGGKAKSAMAASFSEAILLFPLYWFGQDSWGQEGVMAAYLAIRVVHLALIVSLGRRHITVSRLLSVRGYLACGAFMLGVFALSNLLYQQFAASDIVKLLAAMAIGGAMLAAGLFPVRNQLNLRNTGLIASPTR